MKPRVRPSTLPPPRIEAERFGGPETNRAEVPMRRIEEEVLFLRHDGGGNHQDGRPARADPCGAQVAQVLGCRILPPRRRECVGCNLAPGDLVGNISGDCDEVGRGVGRIEMDEVFQGGQRERGGRVDDRYPAMIPTATGLPSAFAVEGRIRPAADPPDTRQLWTPCAMRSRMSSTWRAPSSLSS